MPKDPFYLVILDPVQYLSFLMIGLIQTVDLYIKKKLQGSSCRSKDQSHEKMK